MMFWKIYRKSLSSLNLGLLLLRLQVVVVAVVINQTDRIQEIQIQLEKLKEYLDRIGIPYDSMAINSALYNLGEEKILIPWSLWKKIFWQENW